MIQLSNTQKGELYLYSEALLWSLFPIMTILTYSSFTPLYSVTLSTFAATIFFAVSLTIQKKWKEIKIASAWKDIIITTFIIGIAFYSLMFIGIQKTTAGNAGIVALMEVFFSMVILRLWKKELLGHAHIIGACFMVFGAFLVLFQGSLSVNPGDLIILFATILPPIGNYYAQKARKKVSATYIMFVRSLISSVFLFMLAYSLETTPLLTDIKTSLIFILINGFLLLGLSKVLWIEAIHRIPITKAISLSSVAPAFTLLFAFFILKEVPTIWQIFGFLPMIVGIWLLTDFKTLKENS